MATGKDKVTVPKLVSMKQAGQPITMITAYDAPTGRIVDEAGVDAVLVGDSLGMVVLGYDTTLPVSVEDVLHHTRAVRRGVRRALLIADMPFGSFGDATSAVNNAVRLIKEAGADAIKLEGGRIVAEQVARLTGLGIPVMGHIGMMPQSVHQYGGFKVQGRRPDQREALLADAKALEEAGAFSIVLECIPESLAAEITASVSIPTIGIGAGAACDGQVLVFHDVVGLVEGFQPKFVKRYAHLGALAKEAVRQYCQEVRAGIYPGPEHRYE